MLHNIHNDTALLSMNVIILQQIILFYKRSFKSWNAVIICPNNYAVKAFTL